MSQYGEAGFNSAGGSVGNCSFSGTFTATPFGPGTVASAAGSGSFQCTIDGGTATGTWSISRAPVTLRAASAARPTASVPTPLSSNVFATLVDAACAMWLDAVRRPRESLRAPACAKISISDLPDDILGLATATEVLVDDDAAGFGWFVDPTPHDDDEFQFDADCGELVGRPAAAAVDRIDLLSVLLHELEHTRGVRHEDPVESPHALMLETLPAGVRRMLADTDDWMPDIAVQCEPIRV
jgi:hypothetical protein